MKLDLPSGMLIAVGMCASGDGICHLLSLSSVFGLPACRGLGRHPYQSALSAAMR